jgi:hypothetical protein
MTQIYFIKILLPADGKVLFKIIFNKLIMLEQNKIKKIKKIKLIKKLLQTL